MIELICHLVPFDMMQIINAHVIYVKNVYPGGSQSAASRPAACIIIASQPFEIKCRPVASASFWNLLEMQMTGLQHSTTESRTLGIDQAICI